MLRRFIRKQLNKQGFDIIKTNKARQWPQDFDELHRSIIQKSEPFTMTSPERMFGLIEAVKYIQNNNIEGDIVECGVWKGGSMLAIAETLTRLNENNRKLFLYDTFEGMPPPSEADVSHMNQKAEDLLKTNEDKETNTVWAYSTLDTVKQTMMLSGYPEQKIQYVRGKVEETIPEVIPQKIALLRLDTDWYESTRHELIHLFPLLARGGVLIIDDYGYWKGARKAVDEYIASNHIRILLNRMDDTGRIAIKLDQ
ncbi:MAG: TylF/MycF/NovP-related O-methyltransferase [Flavisolibacter sp.]